MIDEKKQHKINKLIKIISESNPNLSEGIENVIIQDFFGGELVKLQLFNGHVNEIVYVNKLDNEYIGTNYKALIDKFRKYTISFKSQYIDRNHILLLERDVQNYLKAYQNIAIKFITEELKK